MASKYEGQWNLTFFLYLDDVCRSKSEGGQVIRTNDDVNKASIAKLC